MHVAMFNSDAKTSAPKRIKPFLKAKVGQGTERMEKKDRRELYRLNGQERYTKSSVFF